MFGDFAPQLASDAATGALRSAILEGHFPPGHRLKETEIAEELNISRTPIRRALVALEHEGLVETIAHKGARVKTYDPDDLNDMYQLRGLLEGHGAYLAAAKIEPHQVTELTASCDRFERVTFSGETSAIVEENMFFHGSILRIAGSGRLQAMVQSVLVIPLVHRSYEWFTPEEKHSSCRHHRDVVAALAAGDGGRASQVMQEHLLEARDVVLNRLRSDTQLERRLRGVVT